LGGPRARWKRGPKAGRQRVQVQVGNARTMPIFTARATALAGGAASLVLRSGDGQTGTVGTLLPRTIVVLVVDRLGNPVPDARMALLPKSGSVPDSAMRSDSMGQTKVRWTLGRSSGPQRMILRVEGVSATLELTARARNGRPTKLEFLPLRPATASARSAARSLIVQLTDDYGNPIAERTVRFRSASSTVTPTRAVTDAQGQARVRWTPARKATKASPVAEVRGIEARATLTLP